MTTRETILNALKRHGKARADDLAGPLGLTAMAVRQHLYQLQDEGAVTCINQAQGRGRPVKLWELTEKADVYFPDTHRDLSLNLIEGIRTVLGEQVLDELISHLAGQQKIQYKKALEGGRSLAERLSLLAAERSREGYMADIDEGADGVLRFIENHCPICEAAKACSGLCAKELEVFQSVLANDATVRRDEHIIKGARRCAYVIDPKT